MLLAIVPEAADRAEVRLDTIEMAIQHNGRTLYPDGDGGYKESLEAAVDSTMRHLAAVRRAWQSIVPR